MRCGSIGFILIFAICGCGVRGKPLPPLEPPAIGRGEPTYQKYSQRILNEKEESDEKQKEKKTTP